MDNKLFLKVFVVVMLVWCGWDVYRKKRKKVSVDAAIAAADAQERYRWRHLIAGFRIIQFVIALYFIWSLIRILLA